MIDPRDISMYGLAILAFVLAFHALLARERQTPYMIRSIYSIAFLVLIALLLSSVAAFLPKPAAVWTPPLLPPDNAQDHDFATALRTLLLAVAGGLLVVALLAVILRTWREMNRHVWFRDDHLIRNLGIVRFCHGLRLRLSRKTPYEYNPRPIDQALKESLEQCQAFPCGVMSSLLQRHFDTGFSCSIGIELTERKKIDSIVTDLASRFLNNNCSVQYLTCIRHPFELLQELDSMQKKNEQHSYKKRLVVIDGYTPHFGFTDSIHMTRTRQSADLCAKIVSARPSFAGLHTATAQAFNVLKAAEDSSSRSPSLVIYEGCSALIDLESERQYRIFVRHVVPSERMWGGMFTVFIEPSLPDAAKSALVSVCDAYLDDLESLNPSPEKVAQGNEK